MVTFYRRLPKFDYVKPRSLEEVLNLLGDGRNGKYRVYAGGTDMIPKLRGRMIKTPEVLVDLKGIPDMDNIHWDNNKGLRIGALATIFSVVHAPIVKEKYPVLAMAANSIASIQVQNRGTIVGNICNAVPSADSAPALLCLGAKLVCRNRQGERTVDLNTFFRGPAETDLDPTEIVTEIQVPAMPDGGRGVYLKLSPRSRMDLAVVGVGTVVSMEDRTFQDVRIGLGAVAPTPIRAKKAEVFLTGAKVDDETILSAANTASEESKPIDDHRASAEYRRMMVEVLVRRAISQVIS